MGNGPPADNPIQIRSPPATPGRLTLLLRKSDPVRVVGTIWGTFVSHFFPTRLGTSRCCRRHLTGLCALLRWGFHWEPCSGFRTPPGAVIAAPGAGVGWVDGWRLASSFHRIPGGRSLWGSRGLSVCPQVGSPTRGPMPQATGRSRDVSGGLSLRRTVPLEFCVGCRGKVPEDFAVRRGASRGLEGEFWGGFASGPLRCRVPSLYGERGTHRHPGLLRGDPLGARGAMPPGRRACLVACTRSRVHVRLSLRCLIALVHPSSSLSPAREGLERSGQLSPWSCPEKTHRRMLPG